MHTEELYGVSGLREAYKQNLEIVLYWSTMLVNDLLEEGVNVIITADHENFLAKEVRLVIGMEVKEVS